MNLKYIKMFEEYSRDPSIENSEVGHTWPEIRDAIQMKRPFTILIFRTSSSYLEALESYFNTTDYIKQVAILNFNGEQKKYPSLFYIRENDSNYSNEIKNLLEKYDIKYAIVGKQGSEYCKLYSKDGSSVDLGNEIVSTLEPKDFGTDDCFNIGSTYYKNELMVYFITAIVLTPL